MTDPIAALKAGGKRALAAALAGVEARPGAPETIALLDAAFAAARGGVIGLTGPPGVGKSTLTNGLVAAWRAKGLTVGVIAVDPSSRRTRGALLGDRTRLTKDPEDQGVFVRSMAARNRMGGLADLTFPAICLMACVFDRVVVETVGVGQSEVEIADVADVVALCVQPGSGDALQFMKSGVMEAPDLLIVTKADMGAPARRAISDLKGALGLTRGGGVEVLGVSSGDPDATGACAAQLDALLRETGGGHRAHAGAFWAQTALKERFGTEGLATAHASGDLAAAGATPFAAIAGAEARLTMLLGS